MDEETQYAARDPKGIRPLVLGRLERGGRAANAAFGHRRASVSGGRPGRADSVDGTACCWTSPAGSQGLECSIVYLPYRTQ